MPDSVEDGWMLDTVEDGCMAEIAICIKLCLPSKTPVPVCFTTPTFASLLAW